MLITNFHKQEPEFSNIENNEILKTIVLHNRGSYVPRTGIDKKVFPEEQ